MINSPPHYIGLNGIEVDDVCWGFNLPYHSAIATQYILRSQYKGNEIEDLEKAVWNLNKRIQRLRGRDAEKLEIGQKRGMDSADLGHQKYLIDLMRARQNDK